MSSNTFGGTIKLEGESQYRKAISQISAELKVMGSEMSKVTAEFGKNNTSTEALLKTNENLTNKINKQKEKIDILKSALTEASEKYGENDKKTLNWQNSLNKAESELILMQKELEKNNKILGENAEELKENSNNLKDFGEQSDESGKKVLSLGDIIKANLISDAIKSGLSSMVNSVKQFGSMLIGVGKQALESYSDYEQLSGGVETLFKDSSDVVKSYASNAYKTAGMSANEYMETVTSFSASLLQSLNKDTAKSAEVADMAITDMSDNANKMGTSMESIQNAYQGFAKQNYTMLDNLKLGYGGTQEEMQRLLKDATAISGIEYNIDNLSDVYQAIHVIQGELGITGTTAKEASTTIQGSISSLKSAWSNMLTGIADDNADFGTLVTNLNDSLITALNNILPRIDVILSGVSELIVTGANEILPNLINIGISAITNLIQGISLNLPQVLESAKTIMSSLMNGFIEVLPELTNIAFQLIETFVTSLIEMLPQILEAGILLLTELINGIANSLPTLIPTIVNAVILMATTLIDNVDMLIDAAIQLIMGLADGLIEALPILIEKAPEIIQKLIDAFARNFPKIIQAGGELIGKLVMGLLGSAYKLLEVAPQLIQNILSGIKEQFGAIVEAGGNLISGIWEGITGKWEWLKEKIFSFATGITDSIKEFFGIHSPSKLFEDEIGVNLALGLGNGFRNQMEIVKQEMQNVLPSGKDFNMDMTSQSELSRGIFSIETMEKAFTRALKNMNLVVEIDKEKLGEITTGIVDENFGYEV